MQDLLNEFIKPELLVLVPVLYLVGAALKKSIVADKHIPWVLGTIAVAMATVFVVANADLDSWQHVMLALFSGVTQGVLCAGASVYVNQLVKQAGKNE